ncbi:MAG: ribosome-binding factor A [Alphaproteobacteria bacterium]|jgi:ribosome-binding factor A
MRKRASTARSGRTPSQRQLRVGEEIRHALAQMVTQADFRDPDLAGQSITVTEVRVSPDMRNATVFVTPLVGDAQTIVPALQRASSYIRGQLSSAVKLRHTPSLKFEYDDSFDQAQRIDSLLQNTDSAPDPADRGDGNGA